MYSRGASEEVLGRALRDFATRDEVVIATKVFFPMGDGPNDRGLSRKHILDAIDASLRRLGIDYVDLYQIHRWDPRRRSRRRSRRCTTSSRRARRATSARRACTPGSSRRRSHLADRHGWTRFVSMQNHYNLVYREEEREMLPLCRAEGDRRDSVEPAGARLPRRATGARRGLGRHAAREDRRLRPAAVLLGRRLRGRRPRGRGGGGARRAAERRSRWPGSSRSPASPRRSSARPGSSTSTTPSAALDITLSDEERRRLEEPYVPHAVLGHH